MASSAQDYFSGIRTAFLKATRPRSPTIILGFEAGFQAASGTPLTLGAADPWRYSCLYLADLVSQAFAAGNWVAGQNTLKAAVGANLDVLGSFWGEMGARLAAAYALTTLTFSVTQPADSDITIPAGTSVATSAGTTTVNFATLTDCILIAGQFAITTGAQCTTKGSIGNGFLLCQLTCLHNWYQPFIISVWHTTTTSGGDVPNPTTAIVIGSFCCPKPIDLRMPRGLRVLRPLDQPDYFSSEVYSDPWYLGHGAYLSIDGRRRTPDPGYYQRDLRRLQPHG
jgi:hypothetical protein